MVAVASIELEQLILDSNSFYQAPTFPSPTSGAPAASENTTADLGFIEGFSESNRAYVKGGRESTSPY